MKQRAVHLQSDLLPSIDADDDAGQLPLFAPGPAPRSFDLQMTIDFPGGADPELVKRLDRAGRRLRRGCVAARWKLKKLATALEEIACLFDGAKR